MSAVAYALIGIGSFVAVLNWGAVIARVTNGRFASPIPIIGVITLGSGLAIVPDTRSLVWLAFVADGWAFTSVIEFPRFVHEMWSTSRFNLVHSFEAKAVGRSIEIKLFRRHIAVISAKFDPPIPCNEYARVGSFNYVGRWNQMEGGFSIDNYGFDRQLLICKVGETYVTEERNYPTERRINYDYLGGLAVLQQK